MADNNQPIEWYLARDGQQHGPVSDTELKKIIELGYLRPTDLVWREGMAEWATAETVLALTRPSPPPAPAPVPRDGRPAPHQNAVTVDANRRPTPQARGEPEPAGAGYPAAGMSAGGHPGAPQGAAQQRAPQSGGQHSQAPHGTPGYHGYGQQPGSSAAGRGPVPAPVRPEREAPLQPDEPHSTFDEPERRGFPWRTAAVLAVLAGLAGGGWALYRSGALTDLPFLAAPATSDRVPVISRPAEATREASAATTASISAPTGAGGSIDESLQKSALWKLLKRDFPEWYRERLGEITKLSNESKSER